MNTRIQTFVGNYKAILALKKTHTKRIDLRDFVVEAALVFFMSFGIVPIIGLIGNLNQSFSYLYIASVAMILFNYIILMWLFETRYQLANKLDYNIWGYIIPKTGKMVLVLLSGFLVYGAIAGILLIGAYFEGTGLMVLAIIMLFIGILFVHSMLPKERTFLPYLYQGILIAGLYWMFGFALNYNIYVLWTYIAHVLIIIIVLGRDWLIVSDKKAFVRSFGVLFTLIIISTVWILFNQLRTGAYLTDITETRSNRVNGAAIQEGRVVGTYSDHEYLYIKYLDSSGMHADVYNHEFEYQYSTETLELAFDFITIDSRVYAAATDPELQMVVLYSLDGADFEEQFRTPYGYFLYGTIWSGDSFWFVKIERSRDDNDEWIQIPTLYRAKDGVVTEEDITRYDFRHEDRTTIFEVQDGEVYIDSTNTRTSYTFGTYANTMNDSMLFKTPVNNMFYTSTEDTRVYTIYDRDMNVIASNFSYLHLTDENYYTKIERPFYDDGIVYAPYTSGFPYQDQNIVAYALFDPDGELLDVYQSKEALFYLNDTVYEIKEDTIREYNGGGITVYGSAMTMTVVILFIGLTLMIPVNTKVILVGGDMNV